MALLNLHEMHSFEYYTYFNCIYLKVFVRKYSAYILHSGHNQSTHLLCYCLRAHASIIYRSPAQREQYIRPYLPLFCVQLLLWLYAAGGAGTVAAFCFGCCVIMCPRSVALRPLVAALLLSFCESERVNRCNYE